MAEAQDYDGHPRIVHDQVDVGAFEAILPNWTTDDGLPLAWLWQYWHSLTGITAHADSDGDNFNNLDEYLAGTDPLNAASYLGIESMQQAGSGFEIEWQSIDGKLYSIRRSTNLVEGFSGLIATNIVGVAPMNTVTDTAPAATGFRVYRVELQ
jgi:hypothetical protein